MLPYLILHHIYNTLHYTLHYVTLRYITLHYNTLHYSTLHYIRIHYIKIYYNKMDYIALHYITLYRSFPRTVKDWNSAILKRTIKTVGTPITTYVQVDSRRVREKITTTVY